MAKDSLGKRYIFKLASNLASVPLYFVMEAVLPRALGPAAYGNFSFATELFMNFNSFLDMGTSTCMQTSLAKRPSELSLLTFYSRFCMLMLLFCLTAGLAMHLPGAGINLLPDVPLWMAIPSALWAYITWLGRVARSANDALGITTRSEVVRIGVNLFSAFALLTLFFGGLLTLRVFYFHQYASLGALAAGFLFVLRQHLKETGKLANPDLWKLPFSLYKSYAREFARYSSPLFITALSSALVFSGERWLLQFFGGSVQQGFFSLSVKIGLACFLFVTALTPLLMREMAVAHGNQDRRAIARLLDRYAPMLYAVAAWFACFILVEAPAVVKLFGGAEFAEALLPVQIMALYPIHQGYGQLANSIFYATGETPLLRNISLFSMVIGLVFAWFFLAPVSLFGLNLGATGLAIKKVFVQIITVTLLFYYSRKFAPFNLRRNLLHQLICPLAFLGAALGARQMTTWFGLGDADSLVRFFISGVAYSGICFLLALGLPFVFGLARGDIVKLVDRFFEVIKARRR